MDPIKVPQGIDAVKAVKDDAIVLRSYMRTQRDLVTLVTTGRREVNDPTSLEQAADRIIDYLGYIEDTFGDPALLIAFIRGEERFYRRGL